MLGAHQSLRLGKLALKGVSAIAAICMSMSAFGTSQSPAAEGISPAPAFTAEELMAHPTDGWLTNGGNIYNQHYSPLDQINRTNVSDLKAVWRASLNGSGLFRKESGEAQTLVYDGTLYVVTGGDDAFAIDIETGKVIWQYKANIDPKKVVVCCGWTSRGLGMGEGMVFVGQLDNKLVALDQKTGNVVWSIQTETTKKGYSITAAPLYYDGLVIIGYAGGDMGIRGKVRAYDAKTGKLVWTFYTIPGPGEVGHDTWPKDSDIWKVGGAPIWQTPAIDPELGLIYIATGNPAPDLHAGSRPGDNLFTVSIVAIDVKTGKYRWHYQMVHHDMWDYDAANPIILFDAKVDGVMRKGLVEIPKNGYVYILDRVTGKPLIGINETPVMQNADQATSPTQPIPVGDDIVPHSIDIPPEDFDVINQGKTYTPFGAKAAVYKPSAAVSWPPSSYDPTTHTMYICANDGMGMMSRTKEKDFKMPAWGEPFLGGAIGRVDAPHRGLFQALDVTTNRIVWRRQWTSGCGAGLTATAGGLIFTGRRDGHILAFDSGNGRPLWRFQVDAPVLGSIASFEYKGTQYLAVLVTGSYYSSLRHSDGVWLFSLNGTMKSLPPDAAQVQKENVAVASGPPDLAHGKSLYQITCVPCHGVTGKGGHSEGAPIPSGLTVDAVVAQVANGGKDMPAFGSGFSSKDMRDLANYVVKELQQN